MKESITTLVIAGGKEKELTFQFSNNEVVLEIENEEVCRLDYVDNLLPLMQRMIEMWGNL